jgi:tetratricopeptide (TPR) repeat protein
MAQAFFLLGSSQRALDKTGQALTNLNRSLDIFQDLNDKIGMADVLQETGETYQQIGRHQIALEYYLKSLDITKEINSKIHIYKGKIGRVFNLYHCSFLLVKGGVLNSDSWLPELPPEPFPPAFTPISTISRGIQGSSTSLR